MKTCIIGLGYVGLTLAVHLAKNGKSVHGVEISKNILNALESKTAHFHESGFDEVLSRVITNKNFTFSDTIPLFQKEPKTYIITVGTPTDKANKVNTRAIESVAHQLAEKLNDGDLVILRSTVKIGTTRSLIKPILDTSNSDYHLAFCPERTLEGCALKELANLPQIIAGIDLHSLEKAKTFFSTTCKETVPLNLIEEAEMVKLLNNSERDLMFALANEIGLMCDAKKLNAHKIIAAANHQYPRANLKKPGPVGGPCLEKDPHILTESFENAAYQPVLFTKSREINTSLIKKTLTNPCNLLKDKLNNQCPKKITILGFSFKGTPPTSDMRGSLVYDIVAFLKDQFPGTLLMGHDYLVPKQEIEALNIQASHNVKEATSGADMIILQNNHPRYKEENWASFNTKNTIIFDFWYQLKKYESLLGNNYLILGKQTGEYCET